MKKWLILLFLVSVILMSGCAQQGTPGVSSTKDGVIIKSFAFDSSAVNEKDAVGLNLEIQNVGGVVANLESMRVYGGWNVDQNVDLSGINRRLAPSQPEVEFEGESRFIRLRLTAPDITAETNYNFGTRVVYRYSTVYTGTLRMVQADYLETLSEAERSVLLESSGVVSSSVTGGPLSVKPTRGRNFIVSGGGGTSSLVFELNNEGSGYPASGNVITTDTMYKVSVVSATGIDCADAIAAPIKLSKGKNRLFSCDFSIPPSIVNKQDIIFTITFNYYYYVDGMTSITVQPDIGG